MNQQCERHPMCAERATPQQSAHTMPGSGNSGRVRGHVHIGLRRDRARGGQAPGRCQPAAQGNARAHLPNVIHSALAGSTPARLAAHKPSPRRVIKAVARRARPGLKRSPDRRKPEAGHARHRRANQQGERVRGPRFGPVMRVRGVRSIPQLVVRLPKGTASAFDGGRATFGRGGVVYQLSIDTSIGSLPAAWRGRRGRF